MVTSTSFKNPLTIIGIIATLIGLYGLISSYYWYYYMKNLKAGEHPEAPVYNFVFENFPQQNRPMTIYEASLKKDIVMRGIESRIRDSGIILAIGISLLIWGRKK